MAPLERTILTDRLSLKLIEDIEEDSDQLKDVHIIRSNPEATQWSVYGTSKSLEETRKLAKNLLPEKHGDSAKAYRATYIVYLKSQETDIIEKSVAHGQTSSTAVGLISIVQSQVYGIAFPDHLTLPDNDAKGKAILKMEVGYMFLPETWGKGYCTEALRAVLKAYGAASDFWKPYAGVYIQAVTGDVNIASQRVLEKGGLKRLGLHTWDGERVFLAGAWRDCCVMVFGVKLPPATVEP